MLARLLEKNLDSNLTFHSLAHHTKILAGSTGIPLLVCNGAHDAVVCSQKQTLWHDAMKPGVGEASPQEFRLWQCLEGNYFFHFHHAEAVAGEIAEHVYNINAQLQNQTANCEPIAFNATVS